MINERERERDGDRERERERGRQISVVPLWADLDLFCLVSATSALLINLSRVCSHSLTHTHTHTHTLSV